MINNEVIGVGFIIALLAELLVSFALGYGLGRMLSKIMSLKIEQNYKAVIIVFVGYLVYVFTHYIGVYSIGWLGHEVFLELY